MIANADFIRAILDDPSDTNLRLVYADWLDERGDVECLSRAEYLRLECQLDGLVPGDSGRRELRNQLLRRREVVGCDWWRQLQGEPPPGDGATHVIRPQPPIYYTGKTPEGRQILLGWVEDFIGVLFFHRTGHLLATREYPLGIDLRKGLGPAVETVAHKTARAVKRELGFRNQAIRVRPFAVDKWGVVLKRFPEWLEDVLADPGCFTEEGEWDRKQLEQWQQEGMCELTWGNSHHLARDGRRAD